MATHSRNREFGFILNDVARLLRTYADYRAAQFGMTRAQWAVLVRLDRSEGLNQSELAEMLDLQPITLTRLLEQLGTLGEKTMASALEGVASEDIERMVSQL